MESYLSNRKQYVEIDDLVSEMLELTTGVQQDPSWVHHYLLFT